MSKDLAKRFPSDTPMEVYTPNNIPPISTNDLHLDQSVVQHVINGAPQFDEGITIRANKKLIMDWA